MKISTLAALVAGATYTLAFPQFDPSKQCFDLTQGDHKFVPPGPKDIRGMCPGLNIMANHGWIPHNGVATFSQLVQASIDVFNTAEDIANLLAAYGVAMSGSGDADHMSIGGPPGDLAPTTEKLLRNATGLASSHVSFESDASPTRGDLYELDSTANVQQARIDIFASLYEKQDNECPGSENYSMPIIGTHQSERLTDSIANNKDMFLSPFGGLLVQRAAHSFIFQLLANRTEEHPEGNLNRETLTSAFGIQVCDDIVSWWPGFIPKNCNRPTNPKCAGNDTSFKKAGKHPYRFYKYEVGYERLPDYWCKRADNLTLGQFNTEIMQVLKDNPDILHHTVGGNTGTVNSWKSADLNKLTNGTYPDFEFLLKDNNYACLGLQQAVIHAPLWLDKMYENSTKANNLVLSAAPMFNYLNCPNVTVIDPAEFAKFPGWNRSFTWPEWTS